MDCLFKKPHPNNYVNAYNNLGRKSVLLPYYRLKNRAESENKSFFLEVS